MDIATTRPTRPRGAELVKIDLGYTKKGEIMPKI